MHHNEILATINMAHYFDSAFTVEQTYRFLKIKMTRADFDSALDELCTSGAVSLQNGVLFTRDLQAMYHSKVDWSRRLFNDNRRQLRWLSRVPGVAFCGLTGANAFESCQEEDDIDIFVVTRERRLWLTYILLVLFSKLLRKRGLFCINYLVDETRLHIPQHDYYTAIQILQMMPLVDSPFSERMIEENQWIFKFLPNATPEVIRDDFYLLRSDKRSRRKGLLRRSLRTFLDFLNRKMYHRYVVRLSRKYPTEFGEGIRLSEGAAKLNRVNHQDIYKKIYKDIKSDVPA